MARHARKVDQWRFGGWEEQGKVEEWELVGCGLKGGSSVEDLDLGLGLEIDGVGSAGCAATSYPVGNGAQGLNSPRTPDDP